MLAQSAKVLFAQNFLFTRYTQVSNYKNMLELFGTPNLSVHVLHLQWSSCDVHPTSSQELLGPVAANDEAKCQMGRVDLLIQNWFYKKSKGRQCKGRRPRNFDFFS